MIWRFIYFGACTLVLAAITHIAIILLIPVYGTQDAFAILSKNTSPFTFKPIVSENGRLPLSDFDPFFSYGVCRFDLSETGVVISGPKIDTFWSATIVNEAGTVIYSLNSRTAIDQKLELIVLNPTQILRIRELQPPEIESSIIVETEINGGFVLLRVLSPDASWESSAQRYLDSIACRPYLPTANQNTEELEQPGS
ncbi:MAG: DUF1254 domain-containing protein [Rhizobiaceae bacterium]